MNTLRIGIIGLGGICRQRHLPGLTALENVEITAIANRSRTSAKTAAEKFGIPRVAETWSEITTMEDIDAILIGTWPYMHHPISIAALEAGKHVFSQARMAMNLQEALEMVETARYVDRVAMLCPVPFGLSIDKTILRMQREGRLGKIFLVRVNSLNGDWIDPAAPMTWRKDHRLSGLNTQTLGMYAEVMHRWFGPTRKLRAQSSTFTAKRQDASGVMTPVQIPDQILIQAVMDNQIPVVYTLSGVSHRHEESIEIQAEKAQLYYDVVEDILYEGPPEARTPVPIAPEDEYDVADWRVEADFINAIRKGADYHPNFIDGLRYMQVVQATHDAAKSGKTIHITDVDDLFL